MHRRNLLKGAGILALKSSFPIVLTEFIASCKSKSEHRLHTFFSPDEYQIVEHVADTLLPKTDTPGALDVQVPLFLDHVIAECLQPRDQYRIRNGLIQLNDQGRRNFATLNPDEKRIVLKHLEEGAFKDEPDKVWYRIFKKLCLIGYFTSQEGMTKALNYVQVPGDYQAMVPYKKGDKALAKTFLIYW